MGKPKLIILASTAETVKKLHTQYKDLFEDYLDIESLCIYDLAAETQLSADLVMITFHAIAEAAMKHVSPGTKTLIAHRSISPDSFQRLYDIPEGSNVVIANVDKRSALEALEQMHMLGINHLNYTPYYPSIAWPDSSYQYAVIFDENIPPQVKDVRVINLGTRITNITTCILVAQHFQILKEIQEKIEVAFMKPTINLAHVYYEQLSTRRKLHTNLQTLLNYYEKSILLMNMAGEVLFFNYRAQRLLKIRNGDFFCKQVFLQHFLTKDTGFFIEINEEDYYVEINFSNETSTIYIMINDIESIENISNKYRHSLKANGLVAEYFFHDIICESAEMKSLIKRAEQFAKSNSTIYIAGESGCGKELLAQAIHNASKRQKEAFVAVNFAALSATLSEAELFGYVEGAFTGAKKGGEKGLFELANKGSIFLDEIGDCSSDIQKKILRVIQEKKVMPVGSNKWISIDIRIISATNQELSKLVAEKTFREDLYYRLNVLPLSIPPLRERRADILPLFYSFLKNIFNIQVESIGAELDRLLLNFDWHGNVRQLRSMAEYIANCISANIEDWQDEVKQMLLPRGATPNFYGESGELLCKIEAMCEIHSLLAVLEKLNAPPYLWTRKSLSQVLPEIGESTIKRIILILNRENLAISKKGEGTHISVKGKDFLKYAVKVNLVACP